VKGRSVEIGLDAQHDAHWQLIIEPELAPSQDSARGPAVGKSERVYRSLCGKDPSAAEINVARPTPYVATQVESSPTKYRARPGCYFRRRRICLGTCGGSYRAGRYKYHSRQGAPKPLHVAP
jgi:hypothetical protein